MNKFAYLAAFAAVPCMVCQVSAAEFTAKEKVIVVELASTFGVIYAMENNDLTMSERIEMVNNMTAVLKTAKHQGVNDEMLKAACNILNDFDSDTLKGIHPLFAESAENWEKNNYRGNSNLRKAVMGFIEIYLED